MMRFRHIFGYLGLFLLLSGLISLLPIVVAILYGESVKPFLVSALSLILVGYFMYKSFPRGRISFSEAMVLSCLAFILVSFISSFSFYYSLDGSPSVVVVDSLFESVSGYTTTGFTVLPDGLLNPSSPDYKHSMIFRRSLMQWVGGMGIIVLSLSLMAGGGISTVYLYKLGEEVEKITPTVEHTARIILRVCLFYTLAGIIILYLVGTPLFYAVNATLTSISTGGFAYSSQGLHTGTAGKIVILFLMLAGGLPFTMHYFLIGGKVKRFLSNVDVKSMIIFLIIFVPLLMPAFDHYSAQSLLSSAFNVVSTITTTGHSDIGLEGWAGMSELHKILFIVLMFVGGGAGSTSGGFKLVRLFILIKAVAWNIRKVRLPLTAVVPFKVEGKSISDGDLVTISLYFYLHLMLIALGALIIMIYGVGDAGVGFTDAVFVSTSAQATASMTTIDIAAQNIPVKLTLIVLMLAGRLEVLPLMALAGSFFSILKKRPARGNT